MKLEICILNPYTIKNSNEKLKKTAMKVIEEGSRIFINEDDLIDDYFSHHYETVNISNLIKQVEKNNSSDAFIVASFEDIGVETIRKIISKPIIGIGPIIYIYEIYVLPLNYIGKPTSGIGPLFYDY